MTQKTRRYDQAIAPTWVPPTDPDQPRIVRIEPPDIDAIMPQQVAHPATTQSKMVTSHEDRARGFVRSWTPAAGVAGLLGGIVAVVGLSVPVLSLAVLGWIAGVFLFTWLIGYAVNVLVSPEGVALFSAWRMWRMVEREQNRMWEDRRDTDD